MCKQRHGMLLDLLSRKVPSLARDPTSLALSRVVATIRDWTKRRRPRPIHAGGASNVHGSNVSTPVGRKSVPFRVATIKPCVNAVAAINASRSERGSGTCSLAQRRATATSTGRIRSENAGNTRFSSQARNGAPCTGSRRSIRSTPNSSSNTVMADRNKLATGTLAAHATTRGSALPAVARRSSDTTLVSSRYITPSPPAATTDRASGAARTRCPPPPASPAARRDSADPPSSAGTPRWSAARAPAGLGR